MFEMHDTAKQAEFLAKIKAGSNNAELLDEIIHTLWYPWQQVCLNEAEFVLKEMGNFIEEEDICNFADFLYESTERWVDSEWIYNEAKQFLENKGKLNG